jgi:hypothetical protein
VFTLKKPLSGGLKIASTGAAVRLYTSQQKEHYRVLPFHPGFWYRNGCEMFFACQRSFGCALVSSEASHLFAALVGRTSCLKHLACTFRLF